MSLIIGPKGNMSSVK